MAVGPDDRSVGALLVDLRADFAALRRFEIGLWRGGLFVGVDLSCALYADGS